MIRATTRYLTTRNKSATFVDNVLHIATSRQITSWKHGDIFFMTQPIIEYDNILYFKQVMRKFLTILD